MTIPFFAGPNAAVWDKAEITGYKLPGICSLSGPGIARKLDKKDSPGTDGETLSDEGNKLGQIILSQLIWTKEQWEEAQRQFPLLQPRRKGGPRQPQSFYHPLAELLGIKRIYVEKIPVPQHNRFQGTLVLTYELTEWVPRPVKPKKAAGKSGDDSKGAKQIEQDMEDASGGDVVVLEGGALGGAADRAIQSITKFQNAQKNSYGDEISK